MTTDFGVLVKVELMKRNMSQKELAALMGISPAYLTDLLRGKKTGPKAKERLNVIKKILNVQEEK
ncbi:helix-turn-helix domain-containing protein [Carnobacterium antarcticum]|uniref:Helix-turn-helix domain-containing protein n=1 Tax=Carnobacterium antarcticum TaxID=2126436 RepID=A0ABW4NN84_9LACT|nr:helix-turn-helix transcriptional regulator [Carnobacterium sp. CP1]ALV20721.1 hypothetical protein NY10_96 [Carnobacterium sp. CP1]